MRSNVRRLFSLLLAVALVLGLGLTSVAAIESSLLTLQVTSQHVIRGDEVCVAVNTEADGVVADGKMTFAYDSKSLKFVGAEAGEAWPAGTELSLKVNSGKKDAVVAAFAGAKAAKAGTVLTLKFEALQECRTQVVLQGGYISGAKDAKLQSTATLLVECPASRFTDVDRNEYYHEGIDFVVSRGYMIGMGGTYILGAVLYGTRFPEKFWPGQFDYVVRFSFFASLLVCLAPAVPCVHRHRRSVPLCRMLSDLRGSPREGMSSSLVCVSFHTLLEVHFHPSVQHPRDSRRDLSFRTNTVNGGFEGWKRTQSRRKTQQCNTRYRTVSMCTRKTWKGSCGG